MLFHEFNVLSLPFLHLESLTHFDLNKTDTFFTTRALLKRLIFAPYHSKSQKFDIDYSVLTSGFSYTEKLI